MKKIFLLLIIVFSFARPVQAQNTAGDSLKQGRECRIVLYNGYQADGKILSVLNDTLLFQTDITKLHIPVKDIKFVLNTDADIPVVEISDTVHYEILEVLPENIKMTGMCDVYLDDMTELKDVRLNKDSDSTIKIFKEDKFRVINISGIRKIVFSTRLPFLKGALIGGGIGFLVGFLPVTFSKGHGHPDISGPEFGLFFGSIFAVPSAVIGGLIGLLFAYDEVTLFKPGIDKDKISALKSLMKKHY